MNKSIFNFLVVMILVTVTSACSSLQTAVKKRNLSVETQLSDTVWLDPVPEKDKTVFIQVKNTSDKQSLSLHQPIHDAMLRKGYRVVDDPGKAYYWVQTNILKVGKSDLRETQNLLSGGYGSAIGGAVVGAQFGSGDGQVAMGILGATVAVVGDALIEDTYYTIVTDIQISERTKQGETTLVENHITNNQGTTGKSIVSSKQTAERKKYQTRILSVANQVNLEFTDAEKPLVEGLVNAISGIM